MRGWPIALLIVVGLVAVVGVAAIVAVTGSDDTSIFDLEVGDCFDLPVEGDDIDVEVVEVIDVIDCAEPHEAEVVMIGELNPERDRPYPSDEQLFSEGDLRCADVEPDVDVDLGVREFGVVPIVPNEASWEPLGGAFLCIAVPFGGQL